MEHTRVLTLAFADHIILAHIEHELDSRIWHGRWRGSPVITRLSQISCPVLEALVGRTTIGKENVFRQVSTFAKRSDRIDLVVW